MTWPFKSTPGSQDSLLRRGPGVRIITCLDERKLWQPTVLHCDTTSTRCYAKDLSGSFHRRLQGDISPWNTQQHRFSGEVYDVVVGVRWFFPLQYRVMRFSLSRGLGAQGLCKAMARVSCFADANSQRGCTLDFSACSRAYHSAIAI